MTDPTLVRAVGLFVPVVMVVVLAARTRPAERVVGAAILGTAWNLLVLVPVNLAAMAAGWWSFEVDGGAVHGLPVDLLVGWALLWGAVPALLARAVPLPVVGAALGCIDLALMPLAAPAVALHPGWLAGEVLALCMALVPSLLVVHWTAAGRCLTGRVLCQVAVTGGLFFALPLVAVLTAVPSPARLSLAIQLSAVPVALALAAVREFAVRGGGTPMPYDPPVRLVVTGPYAYVRNPMQTSVVTTYVALACALGDARLLIGALVAFSYGVGFAAWHEGGQLAERFGHDWQRYRDSVRPWLPRLRPLADRASATLFIARSCDVCSSTGDWVTARRPVGLQVRAAETRLGPGLRRMRYESGEGRGYDGVAAFAAALQHLHIGWAAVGWVLAIPGVRWFAQLCADALGAGPRDLTPAGGFRLAARGDAD